VNKRRKEKKRKCFQGFSYWKEKVHLVPQSILYIFILSFDKFNRMKRREKAQVLFMKMKKKKKKKKRHFNRIVLVLSTCFISRKKDKDKGKALVLYSIVE